MKFKTTMKNMRDNNGTIISIGYCDAHSLLKGNGAIAYSSGVYGWNCDYHRANARSGKAVLISTGYRRLSNKGLRVSDEVANSLIREYEKKAEKETNGIDWDKKTKITNQLLQELVDKLV